MKRTLSLKRDALTELDPARLLAIAGGHDSELGSCLDYVSCHITQCVTRWADTTTAAFDTLRDCLLTR